MRLPNRSSTLLFTLLAASLLPTARAAAAAIDSRPVVAVPRVHAAPRLADFIPMDGDREIDGMTRVEGLLARTPRDGAAVSERTVVYLGHDDTHLFAVFLCFDADPRAVRAHRTIRDRIPDSDDSVALQIDTFRDLEHAYGFQVNPLGTQNDGIWTEGRGWDLTFDTVWDSEGRVTDRGYVVLITVPFRSVRFPNAEGQTWGVLLYRGIARKNEECFWPAYSSRVAGRMNQAGLLRVGRLSSARNLQLVPYVHGRSFRAAPPGSGPLAPRSEEGSAGLDVKAVLRDSVALDVTLRPDFSQVESDLPQVTVNRRFEVFFPEKRPFFLENATAFQTPEPLLFTRRIADPEWGARLTGRLGGFGLAGLMVRDGAPSTAGRVDVLRIRREVGPETAFGVFASEVRRGASRNRVLAVDARFAPAAHWRAAVQAATSTSESDGSRSAAGPSYFAEVSRRGQRVNYDLTWTDRSAGFRSDVAFLERSDMRGLEQTLSHRLEPRMAGLLSVRSELAHEQVWERSGRVLDHGLTPRVLLEWPGQTSVAVSWRTGSERLRPAETGASFSRARFPRTRTLLEVSTSALRWLSASATASRGDGVNLAPPAGAVAHAADVEDVTLSVTVRPTASLGVDMTWLRSSLGPPGGGPSVFRTDILRAAAAYHPARRLSARVIARYERLDADAALTSLAARRDLNLDLLVTWLHSPGTAIHAGYNHGRRAGEPGAWEGAGWQVFAKASVLLRP